MFSLSKDTDAGKAVGHLQEALKQQEKGRKALLLPLIRE